MEAILILFILVDGLILIDLLGVLSEPSPHRSIGDGYRRDSQRKGLERAGDKIASLPRAISTRFGPGAVWTRRTSRAHDPRRASECE